MKYIREVKTQWLIIYTDLESIRVYIYLFLKFYQKEKHSMLKKKWIKNLKKAVVVIKHFVYILLIYEEQYDFFLPFLIQFSLIRQTIPPSSYMEVLPGTTRCQLPYKFHQKCIYQVTVIKNIHRTRSIYGQHIKK